MHRPAIVATIVALLAAACGVDEPLAPDAGMSGADEVDPAHDLAEPAATADDLDVDRQAPEVATARAARRPGTTAAHTLELPASTAEATAPTVTLGANPILTRQRRPTLVFSASAGATQYFCRINTTASGAFTACTSPTSHRPASNLADGGYVFSVYVRDAAGRQSATVSHAFMVDATPPTVTLGPNPSLTSQRRPTLVFSTAGNPTQYFCRIDTAAFAACTSSTSHRPASGLPDGVHVFSVYVRDAAGNTSATASHAFTVDATPPTVSITGPSTTVYTSTARFSWVSSEPATTTRCRAFPRGHAGGAWQACASGVLWPTVYPIPPSSIAYWTFQVEVTDAAGNVGRGAFDYAVGIFF